MLAEPKLVQVQHCCRLHAIRHSRELTPTYAVPYIADLQLRTMQHSVELRIPTIQYTVEQSRKLFVKISAETKIFKDLRGID
jgi:hypothetical protein